MVTATGFACICVRRWMRSWAGRSDYGEVKARFEPVYRELDHQRLDALAGPDDADPASLLRWMRRSGRAAAGT